VSKSPKRKTPSQCSLPPQQLRQLGNAERDPPGLVAAEQLGSWPPAGFLLEIDIGERLLVAVADDKAGVRCLHGPWRREAAGRHKRSQESGWVADFTQYHGRLGEHRLNALRLVTLEQLGYRKSASCTSCVARCSRSHCVVMPVAMMARAAASAVEAMYADARIMLPGPIADGPSLRNRRAASGSFCVAVL